VCVRWYEIVSEYSSSCGLVRVTELCSQSVCLSIASAAFTYAR